jgi:hypothetical protein
VTGEEEEERKSMKGGWRQRAESGMDEKKKTEEGEGMAGLRLGKKRGKSWRERAAAASLGFGRTPSFFFL